MTNNSTNNSFSTPVLFLTFNRFDTAQKVFEEIKKAQPQRLYLASDGPRENKQGEHDIVNEIRQYLLSNINWACDVKTLFSDNNLGCGRAVSGAIDWFFQHEEMGIILEDDCLPEQTFFQFCEELLRMYKDDKRIWHINGNTFAYPFEKNPKSSYVFTRFPQVWGWATWKDRWKSYEFELPNIEKDYMKEQRISKQLHIKKNELKTIKDRFRNSANLKIDTWDYQWHATVIKNNGLVIVPSCNLISNLGDGADATHTINDTHRTHLSTQLINFPLKHPNSFFIDFEVENYYKKKMNICQNKYTNIKKILKSYFPFS